MHHDGYDVETIRGAITADSLRNVDVLAIVSALGNNDRNDAPAFTASECDAIESWVRNGGSLLLVADHYPFGDAVNPLARRFGVELHGGMNIDEVNSVHTWGDESQLIFTRQNALLAEHPITRGVNEVVTFTGTAIRGGTPLLLLGDTAMNRPARSNVVHKGGDTRVAVEYLAPQPARGWSQAAVVERGRGRVAILAEAAMLSAQRTGKRAIGMNLSGTGNKQFALNLMHWLTRNFAPAR
jgi:hypothetical protein